MTYYVRHIGDAHVSLEAKLTQHSNTEQHVHLALVTVGWQTAERTSVPTRDKTHSKTLYGSNVCLAHTDDIPTSSQKRCFGHGWDLFQFGFMWICHSRRPQKKQELIDSRCLSAGQVLEVSPFRSMLVTLSSIHVHAHTLGNCADFRLYTSYEVSKGMTTTLKDAPN